MKVASVTAATWVLLVLAIAACGTAAATTPLSDTAATGAVQEATEGAVAAASTPLSDTAATGAVPGATEGAVAAADTPSASPEVAIEAEPPTTEATSAARAPAVTEAPASTSTAPATTTLEASGEASAGPAPADALVSELGNKAWDFLVQLTEEFSPRTSATDEEKAAADFLAGQFEELGLKTVIQSFTVELLSHDPPIFSLNTSEQHEIEAFPLFLTGMGTATGVVVDVGKALPEDIPPEGLGGKIALIRRGDITFEEKVSRVAEAGALAAVVYNNRPGGFGGRLTKQADIPAISISQEDGVDIEARMEAGQVEATVSLVMEIRDSRNVIAEKPGTDESAGVVVIGGHFDTVPETQGANDNGSGIATLLTVAREVSGRSYPFTIRYILFGSEEVGLFGSRHYVGSITEGEQREIIAMLNFDVPGSGDFVEVIGSVGLVTEALEYGDANDLDVRRGAPLEGASSDHAPFRDAGVPVIFILADDISRINAPGDDLEFVEPELMGISAALGVAILDELAVP